ncbi:MAG: InlB B-repeat-containing protein [Bacilli bacterium]
MKKIFVFLSLLILTVFISGCIPQTPGILSIEVVSDQTSFDETFELSDLSLRVYLSNGTHYDVSLNESMLSESDLALLNQTGTHNIQVNYLANSAAFEITISAEDGREVELQATTDYIQWRYQGDTTWNNLVALAILKGADGTAGASGREVEFQTTATHIQWRYEGDAAWLDLVDLANLKGTNGKPVELQTTATHIQWRYQGDATWLDLVALSSLKGDAGDDGKTVELQTTATHIQWRYQGDTTWTNLIALDTLNGADGADGADGINGKAVEFNVSATHIQWRYQGDTTWIDLVALSSLKGEASAAPTIEINEEGYWVINGTVTAYKASGSGTINTVELTITFDVMGGEMPQDMSTVITNIPKGDSISLPIPTKDGYAFCGWFSGFGVNDGQFTNVMAVTKNMTLVAKWEEDLQPLIDFFSITDTKNYTAVYIQERSVTTENYEEHYLSTETEAIQYHDQALHVYSVALEEITGSDPMMVGSTASEQYAYYTNSGFYSYVYLENEDRWQLAKIEKNYHLDFSKEMFDIDLFVKRPGEPIYDYPVTDEFLEMIHLDLDDDMESAIFIYLDYSVNKFVISIEVTGEMEDQIVYSSMEMSITFSQVGTTEVTFPVDTIKTNLLLYIDEVAQNRDELLYAEPAKVVDYNEFVDQYKANIELTNSLDEMSDFYNEYQGFILSYSFDLPGIVYEKMNSINGLESYFDDLSLNATVESQQAMQSILDDAIADINLAETEAIISQLYAQARQDLGSAWIEDLTMIIFTQKQEQYLEKLMHIYESYMDATEVTTEQDELEQLFDLHYNALMETTNLTDLEMTFNSAFDAFNSYQLTVRVNGTDNVKIGFMTYIASQYLDMCEGEFDEPLYTFYFATMNAVMEATTLQEIMAIYNGYDAQFEAIVLTEARSYFLNQLAYDSEMYLNSVVAEDEDALIDRYNEVIAIIQNNTDIDIFIDAYSSFIYFELGEYEYDDFLLRKYETIRSFELESSNFKLFATDESLVAVNQVMLEYQTLLENATNNDELFNVYAASYQALEAVYVYDPTKNIDADIEFLQEQMWSMYQLIDMSYDDENALYLIERTIEIEFNHFWTAQSVEEAELIYESWVTFIKGLPITFESTKIDEMKQEMVGMFDVIYQQILETVPDLPDTFETNYQAYLLLLQNTNDFYDITTIAFDTYYFLMDQMIVVFRQETIAQLEEIYDDYSYFIIEEAVDSLSDYYAEAIFNVSNADTEDELDNIISDFENQCENLPVDEMKLTIRDQASNLMSKIADLSDTATADSIQAMEVLLVQFKDEAILCETVADVYDLAEQYSFLIDEEYVILPEKASLIYGIELIKSKISFVDWLTHLLEIPVNSQEEIADLIFDYNGYYDQIDDCTTVEEAQTLFDELLTIIYAKELTVLPKTVQAVQEQLLQQFEFDVKVNLYQLIYISQSQYDQIEQYELMLTSANDFEQILDIFMQGSNYVEEQVSMFTKQEVGLTLTEEYMYYSQLIIDGELEALQTRYEVDANLIQDLLNPQQMQFVLEQFEQFVNTLTIDELKSTKVTNLANLHCFVEEKLAIATDDSIIEMNNLVNSFSLEIAEMTVISDIQDKYIEYTDLISEAYVVDGEKEYLQNLINMRVEESLRYMQMLQSLNVDWEIINMLNSFLDGPDGLLKLHNSMTVIDLDAAYQDIMVEFEKVEFNYDNETYLNFLEEMETTIDNAVDFYSMYLNEKSSAMLQLEADVVTNLANATHPKEVVAIVNQFIWSYHEEAIIALKIEVNVTVDDLYTINRTEIAVEDLDQFDALYQSLKSYITTDLSLNILGMVVQDYQMSISMFFGPIPM